MQMQQQRQSRKNRKSCNYQESDDPSWNAGVESQMVQRTMEWNRLDIYRLIQEYHSRTLLWDPEDEEHKCRKKRLLALAEISETIGIDQTECEKKMRNLVSQFQREVKKMKTDLTYTSKWFAYEPMLFLENKKKGEKSFDYDILDGLHPSTDVPASQDEEEYFPEATVKPEIDDVLSISASSSQATVPIRSQAYFDDIEIKPDTIPDPNQMTSESYFEEPVITTDTIRDPSPDPIPEPRKEPRPEPKTDIAPERRKGRPKKRRKSDSSDSNQQFNNTNTGSNYTPNPNPGRDEFFIFGEHIANKIRKLPSVHAQNTVQHLISNLLYEAELGKYNYRDRSNGYNN